MLLQPSLHHHHHHRAPALSLSASYSNPLLLRLPRFSILLGAARRTVACSISQVHGYGAVDYERRPMVKWNALYRRISLMEKPELGSASVLNQCEDEGKKLSKWELCRVVKELRKFKRYRQALEVKLRSLPYALGLLLRLCSCFLPLNDVCYFSLRGFRLSLMCCDCSWVFKL